MFMYQQKRFLAFMLIYITSEVNFSYRMPQFDLKACVPLKIREGETGGIWIRIIEKGV